jgi:hypothetical protein
MPVVPVIVPPVRLRRVIVSLLPSMSRPPLVMLTVAASAI